MGQSYTQLLDRILEERAVSSRGRINHRAVKRYKSRYPRKKRAWPQKNYQPLIVILSRNC
jgi:hypothetical protein